MLDHGKKTKQRASSYFHSSFSPISSPCLTIINIFTLPNRSKATVKIRSNPLSFSFYMIRYVSPTNVKENKLVIFLLFQVRMDGGGKLVVTLNHSHTIRFQSFYKVAKLLHNILCLSIRQSVTLWSKFEFFGCFSRQTVGFFFGEDSLYQ